MSRYWLLAVVILASCSHNSAGWESLKTTGRYMQRGVDSMLGKEYESRMLASGDDFFGPDDGEFIPLNDRDLRNQPSDMAMRQPKIVPGQFGLPTLDAFYAAPAQIRSLFQSVHFSTDEHIVRDQTEVAALIRLADYLKKHSGTYLLVEGHADERASAAYNLALGMRRANYIRSFLVKHGASLDQIYTVSRGKEQPIAKGHSTEDWKANRRSEFRIYER